MSPIRKFERIMVRPLLVLFFLLEDCGRWLTNRRPAFTAVVECRLSVSSLLALT